MVRCVYASVFGDRCVHVQLTSVVVMVVVVTFVSAAILCCFDISFWYHKHYCCKQLLCSLLSLHQPC